MVQPKLTQADYTKISQLVYQHSRIHLGDSKMELVSSRLGKRLREHGCSSYSEYCELLHGRHGAEEINHLIDAISTNHTFFFREKKHFEFLESTVFSDFNKDPAFRADGRFRCWSAAASTGEEPYSIAITLARHAKKNPGFRWSMECSDISSTALATAQAGIYPESRLDEMPLDIKRRYFQRGGGSQLGRLRVKSELRANMQWHLMNLFQDSYPFDSKFHVGAGAKLDRDGAKLDSGDGAKLDFCRIALETTGVEVISSESRASSAGYGSAGGQPERWTLPKGLIPRCCGTAYPGPRHSSQKAHWPNAENSGGWGQRPHG